MKRFLILLTILLLSAQVKAQDPDLFQTWYLVSYSVDLGPTYYISDVEPYISPTFVLSETLEFTGMVCNEYGGNFSYDAVEDQLILDFFDVCLCGTCNNPPASHINLENNYFGYFVETEPYYYILYTSPTTNITDLEIFTYPGYELRFQNTPVLSANTSNDVSFSLAPNPAKNQITLQTRGKTIENVVIYTAMGEKIFEKDGTTKSVNVADLSSGLYFLEIKTENGKAIKKFLKE